MSYRNYDPRPSGGHPNSTGGYGAPPPRSSHSHSHSHSQSGSHGYASSTYSTRTTDTYNTRTTAPPSYHEKSQYPSNPPAPRASSSAGAPPGGYPSTSGGGGGGYAPSDYARPTSGPRTHGGSGYPTSHPSHTANSTSRYDHLYGANGYAGYYTQSNGAYEDTYFNSRDEQDREVMKVHQEIQNVKQESLHSTRNAVARLKEAEESAGMTMKNLDEQGESLNIAHSRLNRTEVTAASAASRTEDLKRANKNFLVSTFLPGNPFSKNKRREKKLQKGLDKEDKKNWGSQDTLNGGFNSDGSAGSGRGDPRMNGGHAGHAGQGHGAQGQPQRQNGYGYPQGPSRGALLPHEQDCAIESEIDANLDFMGDSVARLKEMSLAMQDTVGRQNAAFAGMEKKVENTGIMLERSDRKLKKI